MIGINEVQRMQFKAMAFSLYLLCSSSRINLLRTLPINRAYTRSNIKMMPEGPEVKSLTDSIHNRFGDGKWMLVQGKIFNGRYSDGKPPKGWDELISSLPKRVLGIKNKGKFLYFILENEFSLWSTLGLTGAWTLHPNRQHTRSSLVLRHIDDGHQEELFYYDQTNFGTIRCSFSFLELQTKLDSIGICWLTDNPSLEDFQNILRKAKPDRHLAVFLMDQSKTSGIGNYILSEVLYRSRIHPWAQVNNLIAAGNEHVIIELYNTIKSVIQSSYHSQRSAALNDNHSMDMMIDDSHVDLPFHWEVYRRETCPQGFPVRKETGPHKRSIYWVPGLQLKCAPNSIPKSVP